MISAADFYHVMTVVVPAYGSVRWWRIFSLDQCSGIKLRGALRGAVEMMVTNGCFLLETMQTATGWEVNDYDGEDPSSAPTTYSTTCPTSAATCS